MQSLSLDHQNVLPFVAEKDIHSLQPQIDACHNALETGQGAGSDFLGWLHLPSQIEKGLVDQINDTAVSLREQCDVVICIGIGGSYLGAHAAICFCEHLFRNQLSKTDRPYPEIYFAGQNISSDYLSDLLEMIGERSIGLNVISKSGTTTEPAIAFRLLKEVVEKQCGKVEAKNRIVATDSAKGALKQLAEAEGYRSFVIPDDVGGRYSVLTPVGLLPIAVAGINIRELLEGARRAEAAMASSHLDKNPAYLYAAIRHLLYQQGKTTEVMASFHPAVRYVMEWWKQLAGESEGKENQGLFPASVEYTSDLHSMGQWMQEGRRDIFETFLLVEKSRNALQVPELEDDLDGLNYLAGKSLDFVNDKAYKGTAEAHSEGGVPNITLTLKDRSPGALGELFYFFERAVAMTGYLMGVNPFDQPGVEFYKRNMFQLLNKPGYEKGKN